jgi:hypothetical protein
VATEEGGRDRDAPNGRKKTDVRQEVFPWKGKYIGHHHHNDGSELLLFFLGRRFAFIITSISFVDQYVGHARRW